MGFSPRAARRISDHVERRAGWNGSPEMLVRVHLASKNRVEDRADRGEEPDVEGSQTDEQMRREFERRYRSVLAFRKKPID